VKRQIRTSSQSLSAGEVAEKEKNVPLEVLLAFYASARAELLQRIVQRDASLAIFVAGTAAIYGVAINDLRGSYGLLYLVPLLGLGASSVNSQHTRVIGALGNYLTHEFEDGLKTVTGISELPVQWDNSPSLLAARGTVSYRFLASMVLLVLPQAIALAIADYTTRSLALVILGTSVGSLLCGLTFIMEVLNFINRSRGHQARRVKLSSSGT
jgi:hypothetical protein